MKISQIGRYVKREAILPVVKTTKTRKPISHTNGWAKTSSESAFFAPCLFRFQYDFLFSLTNVN
jgi:hypothetical protein